MQSRDPRGVHSIRHKDPIREEEFERVAMPHASTLLRTALRLTSDSGYAEDLVQEVLLRAWRCFDQFEMGTNCKAWLFRIMFNLSSKRQLQIKAKPPGSLDENEFVQPSTVLTSSGFTQTEVLAALDSLAEEHRTVLMLGVVEGFTCKEMAEMLGLPIGTVMSRLSRARATLRKKLTQPEDRLCVCKPGPKVKQARKGAYELF